MKEKTMKAQIEVEVKRVDEGLHKVHVGGGRLLSPDGDSYWNADQLEAAGLPVPPHPITVEATLTEDEADVVEAWGDWDLDSFGPTGRVLRKFADAVKKARSS